MNECFIWIIAVLKKLKKKCVCDIGLEMCLERMLLCQIFKIFQTTFTMKKKYLEKKQKNKTRTVNTKPGFHPGCFNINATHDRERSARVFRLDPMLNPSSWRACSPLAGARDIMGMKTIKDWASFRLNSSINLKLSWLMFAARGLATGGRLM